MVNAIRTTLRVSTRFLRSQLFFTISAAFFLLGVVLFIWHSFKLDVDYQNQILTEIRLNQQISEENGQKIKDLEGNVDGLTTSNNNLRKANERLSRTICALQEQLVEMGEAPVVNDPIICEGLVK